MYSILVRKLRVIGLDENAIRWIESYLGGRSQYVEVEGFRSGQLQHPSCSVIQGSIASCILYAIYTADLPLVLHPDHPRHDPAGERHCDQPAATTYVDDAFIAISDQNLQGITIKSDAAMHKLETYMQSNKLKLNLTKTAILMIPPVASRNTTTTMTLMTPGGMIQSKPTLKILGVFFNDTMSWEAHVNNLVSQLSHKLSILRILAPYTKRKVLRQVAMAIIHSKITYCITVYGYLTQASQQRLQTILLTAARICLGKTYQRASTQLLLTTLGWLSLPQLMEMHSSKLIQQTLTTGIPEALHSRLDAPKAGATRSALSGDVHPTHRSTLRRRRSLCHAGVAAYNKLSLRLKTTSRKSTFKIDVKRYVLKCKPMKIPNYTQTIIGVHSDRQLMKNDLTYYIDNDGRFMRNKISLKTYNGNSR